MEAVAEATRLQLSVQWRRSHSARTWLVVLCLSDYLYERRPSVSKHAVFNYRHPTSDIHYRPAIGTLIIGPKAVLLAP